MQDTESVDCIDSQGKTEIRNVEENKTFTEEKSAESKILQTSSEDTFAGFAARYFHDGATNFYCCKALRKPLLDLNDVVDQISYRSVMTRLRETLKKQLTIEDLEKAVSGIEVHGRLIRNSDEQSSSTSSNSDLSILISNARLNCFLEDPLITDLEKVSFIAGLGILRNELSPSKIVVFFRDEIYCQLCKQLTNNPDNSSVARGWLLLCLCTACFPPSEKFYPCLSKFVSDSSSPYASCEHFLKQVFMKGVRKYPPTWMEIQLLRLEDDSYVMDAVAHCEQDAREGGFEEDGTCKLLLRKEFFSPWHDPSEDLVATNLIYSQVVKGVFIDEYSPDKDDDRAMFAAQRYFIENGQKLDKNVLKSLIDTYIPETYLMDDGDVDQWTDLVADKLKDSYFQNPKIDPLKVKQDVVTYARYKWPLLFSRFYEVNKILGPKLSKNQALIAVNWTGVYAVDDEEQILLELSFPEILSVTVSNSKTSDMTMRSVELSTINGEKYTCLSRTADSLTNLIKTFLDGLQERSKFAVALQSYNSSQLNLKQGDFIILDLQSPNLQETKKDTYIGHNMNNNQKGSFPAECVYKIPTIAKPPLIILKGLYLHEIGHALGLVHEHQLPNRDDYIGIIYENVLPRMRMWFNKYTTKVVDQMNVPYEYSSVMHYGLTAFSVDGKKRTIGVVKREGEDEIGETHLKELAYTDVYIVNLMYNCSSHCPQPDKCGSEGHLDQNCECICKDGSSDCDKTKSKT
ncbi:hypothetical protein Btru_038183, partial [Bulinus truncatus]